MWGDLETMLDKDAPMRLSRASASSEPYPQLVAYSMGPGLNFLGYQIHDLHCSTPASQVHCELSHNAGSRTDSV